MGGDHEGVILAGALVLGLSACSRVMEFNRPDPVDLSQFHPGERRLDVVKVLGPPLTTVNDGPKACDIYHLYTHGPNAAGKAGIAFVEGVADFFTLGIAEVVSTPVEAGTRNSLYPVTLCYSEDAALLSIEESRDPVGAAPTTPAAPATPANASTTAATPSTPAPANAPAPATVVPASTPASDKSGI